MTVKEAINYLHQYGWHLESQKPTIRKEMYEEQRKKFQKKDNHATANSSDYIPC